MHYACDMYSDVNHSSTMRSIRTVAGDKLGVIRLASVSYLNAKPLVEGLDAHPDLDIHYAVPSGLLERLQSERADVALLPVIDYQRGDGFRIVPAGGIGCDGPTLTVRIFSKTPIGRIEKLACDADSHTSVVLARIVLAEHYGIRPEFVSAVDRNDSTSARLLIGDKVVCEEPVGYEHQVDLGEAWKEMTGLPFVFAIWTARAGVNLHDLPARLERAKNRGLSNVDAIVREHGVPRGWPPEIARRYLTQYLKFDIGPRQLQAIELFHELAARHGAIDRQLQPLRLYPDSAGKDVRSAIE